jgi:hypothetical protein
LDLADVVNNTEPTNADAYYTALLFFEKLFDGTDRVHGGNTQDLTDYSWNALIGLMNESAQQRASVGSSKNKPEVYGVSGATTNRFRPGK